MPDLHAQITDYLKTHGPAKPREILDKIGGTTSALNRVLARMLEAKELKAIGKTRGRTYALPGQKIDDPAAPAKRKAKKSPAARPRRRSAPPTADHRLVINHGAAAPQVFSPEHTREIADIAFANFTQ